MTGPELVESKEQVRSNWIGIAENWHRWHPHRPGVVSPATQQLIDCAALTPGLDVLDLASGGGDPAIPIAARISPGGTVTATDLVPEMIAPLVDRIRQLGLRNLSARTADAEDLPFADAVFDRVTCRFGAMFFPDVDVAMREARRVLRPGGRVALMVFGKRAEHRGIHTILTALSRHVVVEPAAPRRPGMFRFEDPAELVDALENAGFGGIELRAAQVTETAVDNAEEYLARRDRIFRQHVDGLSPDEIAAASEDALAALRELEVDGRLELQTAVQVVSALR